MAYFGWPPTTFVAQGWECPKCHRVFSPSSVMCFFCPGTTVTQPLVADGAPFWKITYHPTVTNESVTNVEVTEAKKDE